MVIYTRELVHQLYGDRPSADEFPGFMTEDLFESIDEDLEDCRIGFAEAPGEEPVNLEVELVSFPGFTVSIFFPTPDDGYFVVVPAGLLVRTLALSRRLFVYRNALPMRIPQWAKNRYEITSLPPSGFEPIFADMRTLALLRAAAENFDAETLKTADNGAGFDDKAEAAATDCARIALDFVVQHEIAHARFGHIRIGQAASELTPIANRMLFRGHEILADVVAAALSVRLLFENAQYNGWTKPDLFNRIVYWTGFSHTLGVAVLDPRNRHRLAVEVVHPHPHLRQEFIYKAALAELARNDLASVFGNSADNPLTQLASSYLSGINLAVNSIFWACCVISGLGLTDMYPAFALRKTSDWKLNRIGYDYACLVIAKADEVAFSSPTSRSSFLNRLAGAIEELSFPEKDVNAFLASALAPHFGSRLTDALDCVRSLLNEDFVELHSIDEGADEIELVLFDPKNLSEVIKLPDELPGSGPRHRAREN